MNDALLGFNFLFGLCKGSKWQHADGTWWTYDDNKKVVPWKPGAAGGGGDDKGGTLKPKFTADNAEGKAAGFVDAAHKLSAKIGPDKADAKIKQDVNSFLNSLEMNEENINTISALASAMSDAGAPEVADAFSRHIDSVDDLTRNHFTNDELSLPTETKQKHAKKEKLFESANEALQHMLSWLNRGKGVDAKLGLTHVNLAQGDSLDLEKPGPVLITAPLKSADRASEKVMNELGGDWSGITDLVRASIGVDSFSDLDTVLETLRSSGMKLAKKPRDRFEKPTPSGYRDLILNVEYPNGHVGELQIHTKPILQAKEAAHKLYEKARVIDGNALRENRDLTPEEQKEVDSLNRQMEMVYSKAWEKSIKPKSKKTASLVKGAESNGTLYLNYDNKPVIIMPNKLPSMLVGDKWVHVDRFKVMNGSEELGAKEFKELVSNVKNSFVSDDDADDEEAAKNITAGADFFMSAMSLAKGQGGKWQHADGSWWTNIDGKVVPYNPKESGVKLTDEQSSAVHLYTTQAGHQFINLFLHGKPIVVGRDRQGNLVNVADNDPPSGIVERSDKFLNSAIKDIDSAMSPLSEDTEVIRVWRSNPNFKEGGIYNMKGYLSTSTNPDFAEEWEYNPSEKTEGLKMVLSVPKGTKALDIAATDQSYGEGELLLQRGLSIKIDSLKDGVAHASIVAERVSNNQPLFHEPTEEERSDNFWAFISRDELKGEIDALLMSLKPYTKYSGSYLELTNEHKNNPKAVKLHNRWLSKPDSDADHRNAIHRALKSGIDIPETVVSGHALLKTTKKNMVIAKSVRDSIKPVEIPEGEAHKAIAPAPNVSGNVSLDSDGVGAYIREAYAPLKDYKDGDWVSLKSTFNTELKKYFDTLDNDSQGRLYDALAVMYNEEIPGSYGDKMYQGIELEPLWQERDVDHVISKIEPLRPKFNDMQLKAQESIKAKNRLTPEDNALRVAGVPSEDPRRKSISSEIEKHKNIIKNTQEEFRRLTSGLATAGRVHVNPEARKKVYDFLPSYEPDPVDSFSIPAEHIDNYEDCAKQTITRWLAAGGGASNALLSSAVGRLVNPDGNFYTNFFSSELKSAIAFKPLVPSKRYQAFAQQMYQETQEIMKRLKKKKEIKLYRGVKGERTTPSGLEPWTTIESNAAMWANKKNGGYLYACPVSIENVFISWETQPLEWDAEDNLKGKKEYTLIGPGVSLDKLKVI